MNRLELVDRVAARNTASKAEVDRIIVSAGESIRIPGTKKPKFVPGTSFKELINETK